MDRSCCIDTCSRTLWMSILTRNILNSVQCGIRVCAQNVFFFFFLNPIALTIAVYVVSQFRIQFSSKGNWRKLPLNVIDSETSLGEVFCGAVTRLTRQ